MGIDPSLSEEQSRWMDLIHAEYVNSLAETKQSVYIDDPFAERYPHLYRKVSGYLDEDGPVYDEPSDDEDACKEYDDSDLHGFW